jgi:ferredoxin-type protein NapG
MEKQSKELSRRQFIKSSAVAVGAMTAIGAGVGYLKKITAETRINKDFLRPPGAIDEDTFIYGCIKCGLCVQICPIQAIKLAGIKEGLAYGTPYIDVREQACDFSCDSLQCVETCPTAVLYFKQFKEAGEKAIEEYNKTHEMDENYNPFPVQIEAMKSIVKMGVAIINQDTCLAFQGKGFKGTPRGKDFKGVNRSPYTGDNKATPVAEKIYDSKICDICVKECPIGETAIVMENNSKGKLVPKVLKGCTGCGVCVMVCPTEGPSIIVEPVKS